MKCSNHLGQLCDLHPLGNESARHGTDTEAGSHGSKDCGVATDITAVPIPPASQISKHRSNGTALTQMWDADLLCSLVTSEARNVGQIEKWNWSILVVLDANRLARIDVRFGSTCASRRLSSEDVGNER
jgi:hypothetical protein